MLFIVQYMKLKNLIPRKGTKINATFMRTDGFGVHECRYVRTLI